MSAGGKQQKPAAKTQVTVEGDEAVVIPGEPVGEEGDQSIIFKSHIKTIVKPEGGGESKDE